MAEGRQIPAGWPGTARTGGTDFTPSALMCGCSACFRAGRSRILQQKEKPGREPASAERPAQPCRALCFCVRKSTAAARLHLHRAGTISRAPTGAQAGIPRFCDAGLAYGQQMPFAATGRRRENRRMPRGPLSAVQCGPRGLIRPVPVRRAVQIAPAHCGGIHAFSRYSRHPRFSMLHSMAAFLRPSLRPHFLALYLQLLFVPRFALSLFCAVYAAAFPRCCLRPRFSVPHFAPAFSRAAIRILHPFTVQSVTTFPAPQPVSVLFLCRIPHPPFPSPQSAPRPPLSQNFSAKPIDKQAAAL